VLCRCRHNTHWSGAPSRLNRTFGRRFGDDDYAFEELIAEIGAAALGLRIGLRPQLLDDHAAYLGHWARMLRDRPSALLEASGHAQRAVDYLLGFAEAAAEAA
jgi:antirestriction protein ArdC